MEDTGVPLPLTPREQQVRGLAIQGRSSKEIANALAISPRTVKFHLAGIYRKLHVSGQLELIVKAGLSIPKGKR